MSRFGDQVRDEYGRTIPGVKVYVFKWDADANAAGDLETLLDDSSAPLANPVITDDNGLYYFNSLDGQKLLEFHYGGKVQERELILVGALPVPQATFGGLFINAAALTIPVGMDLICTTGYSTLDVGAAVYVYDAAVNSAYVTANPRSSFVSLNGRGFRLSLEQDITAEMLGAVGDGVANDRAALAAADVLGPINLTRGNYFIGSSLALSSRLVVQSGAKFIIPTGVTLTLNGEIDAAPEQIFDTSGGGVVAIDGRKTPTGWAEWWGLTPESVGAAAANLGAINTALIVLRETRLLPRTYYTSGQITHYVPSHRLIGGGCQYDGANEGRVTRILCTSATAHILYVGGTSFTTRDAMPRGLVASDIYLDRSVAPNVTSGCTGCYNKWTTYARLTNIKSNNSVNSFQFSGTVHTIVDDPHAMRDTVGTGGADIWHGFHVEGATAIGLNSSNASLYLNRPLAEGGIAIADSVGIYADHKMTDLIVYNPETVNTNYGIEIAGDSANTTLNYDNIDIQIIGPTLDQCATAGLYVHGMNKFGALEVTGGYYSPKAGASAAILISGNLAAVRINGGQQLMGVSASANGIKILNSSNVMVDGTSINEATVAAVSLDAVTNCRIRPFVKNQSVTTAAAVAMANACTANVIAPMVSGGASKVTLGVSVTGTADGRNEYNLSGIDSACINGGSGNKLVRNAVQITAVGPTGTNYVSGVVG